jgi:hypothetical protein
MKRTASAGWLGLALLAAALLSPLPTSAQTGAEMGPDDRARVAIRAGGRANVRSAPTTSADNVVGQVDADGLVTIRAAERQGAHVWYDVETATGLTGWIRGDLLERVAEAPGAC